MILCKIPFPDSPHTVDFLYELSTKFSTIVTDKLDQRSREAVQQQQDLANMTDSEAQKIRKSVSNLIHGN